MILRNYTPFRTLFFDSRDVAGCDYSVLVLRGTFDIIHQEPLCPNPKQEPIVESDIWHDQPNASSVYMDSDLSPFKPRTDIIVNAVAHAPSGHPESGWVARVKVGSIEKALRVTGPRAWVRDGGSFRLEDPEPVKEVPLRYENAFGGTWRTNWGETHICMENPVGRGFVEGDIPITIDRVEAPQIESLDDPVTELGRPYRVEGLGVIARSWQPRLKRAGTMDEEWQRTRCPKLPLDFDFAFYNGAHSDLIAPSYLKGDENVMLEGLSPNGTLEFSLPNYKLGILVHYKNGTMGIAPVFLDTLFVDITLMKARLVWRAQFEKKTPIRLLEPRMMQAQGADNG